jgi:adenine-specific DNA methylase
VVVNGSSEHIPLASRSVSLVLTDPPYYDAVQYGELSQLFLPWMPTVGIARRAGSFDSHSEVVPNRTRRAGLMEYRQRLTRVMSECFRVLRPDGRLILTYHSTQLRAWWALSKAISDAGFFIRALATAETENPTDHAKRGKLACVTDLIIECGTTKPRSVAVMSGANTSESRELKHIGAAIAQLRGGSYEDLRKRFVQKVGKMRIRRIKAPIERASRPGKCVGETLTRR